MKIYNDICEIPCGRIRDLPASEQAAFTRRLDGQTRPLVTGLPMKDQDYFYVGDYYEWKAGLPVGD